MPQFLPVYLKSFKPVSWTNWVTQFYFTQLIK